MAVHLRRLDYKYAHKTNVPSIPHAAKQIKAALKKHKLDVVYVSTDAPSEGFTSEISFFWKYSVIDNIYTQIHLCVCAYLSCLKLNHID